MIELKNVYRFLVTAGVASMLSLTACAPVDFPSAGTPTVPPAKEPLDRYEALNERRDPVTRVRLGGDMLVPQVIDEDKLPQDQVGPFELRGETLASALQMILDDYDISIAFESNAAFDRKITVANLKGDLRGVVDRVCSLADLYCHYEKGNMTIKETETFVVDLPPIGNITVSASTGGTDDSSSSTADTNTSEAYTQIATGLGAIIGSAPTVDNSTRIMIYTATQRTNKNAKKYFERLRKNTALIVFETNIWEVTLDNDNRTGIEWTALFNKIGSNHFKAGLDTIGSVGEDYSPVSITPGYTGSGDFSTSAVLQFISSRGAVKTISQPQITMLSGSKATLNVTQSENFVSGITRSEDSNGNQDVSTTTETVDTGLSMTIKSAWDESTIYGGVSLTLDDLLKIDEFKPDSDTTIQLPQTTKRSLQTEIRVRPGDAILIGGLVSEKDGMQESGPGLMKPLFPTSRSVVKENTELVFLLRPRVVVFDMGDDRDTPQVVNSSRDGVSLKSMDVSNITNKVKHLFAEKESPMQDLTGKVGKMMGVDKKPAAKTKNAKVEAEKSVKIKMVEETKKSEEAKAPVKLYKREPVSDPRELLLAPEPKPAVKNKTKVVKEDEEENADEDEQSSNDKKISGGYND